MTPAPRTATVSIGSLIQALEKEGIGRPSTYAAILDTLLRREYVVREKKMLHATPLGMVVGDFIKHRFPTLFDLAFTAKMEQQLDEVSNGRVAWDQVIETLWNPLSEQVQQSKKVIKDAGKIPVPGYEPQSDHRRKSKRKTMAVPIGEACPDCGKPLVRRSSRHGPFIGCSGFPDCHYTRSQRD